MHNSAAVLIAPSSPSLDDLALLAKAAGDALRLRILRALANDSFGVLELTQVFATTQSGMSHHLKVLAQAGLVATRREGNAIFYRRALPQTDSPLAAAHSGLLQSLDSQTLEPELCAKIAQIHAQRAAISRDYFARVADKFQAQQDLIASLPQYHDSVLSLLDSLNLPAEAHAIEVGPGDGAFLPALARRFARVSALDNSAAMLEQARQHCAQAGLNNVSLQLADALSDPCEPADCVVLNMVLHHLPAPAEALQQLSRLLKPGASLLLTELCPHDQAWARDACGDLWLGFEQDDLAQWAAHAGLRNADSVYVGLRNGFQLQIRHFQRPPAGDASIHRP
ncbi:ArsR/SmtB family transcription factor [Atopomonas sediminilitoris]|uniref:ArsR/SmtB family transcription factor n=1 Tax=Atopomonas sediminilitoris TaxID=2919919 RepID=UPI001F4D7DA3|nr:metalloregulator ArsR/SmtB family transcription factor [Atopomonas sediminilitoris]MCJ8170403.1 metalloregulator ArsR/SmtB family transcription factor [Atopomonas sediminilitoris]